MVAVEVAEMETTIQYLRDHVRKLELDNRTLETENAMYQARCRVAEESALNELVRSTQMRQTLTDMSAMVIAGLRKMEENVDKERRVRAEKEALRREQEAAMAAEMGEAPLFITKNEPPPVTAPSEATPAPEIVRYVDAAESSSNRIPVNAWAPDVQADLKQLVALGEADKA